MYVNTYEFAIIVFSIITVHKNVALQVCPSTIHVYIHCKNKSIHIPKCVLQLAAYSKMHNIMVSN